MKADFETSSPQVVQTLLTIASYPNGEAVMEFNNEKYEVRVVRISTKKEVESDE